MTSLLLHLLGVGVIALTSIGSQSNGFHPPSHTYKHDRYLNYTQIKDYLRVLERKGNNCDVMRIVPLNELTSEGRTVLMVKLSTQIDMPYGQKPSILVEAGTHAREHISPAATLYVIEKLLEDYSNNTGVKSLSLLEEFDWYIIPVNNPDGYDFSLHPNNTLWRKNRRVFEVDGKRCVGVDVNRNYNYTFGKVGVSSDCNGLTYPGTYPFSEAESRNVKCVFEQLYPNIKAFVAVHSYYQALLVPFSNNYPLPYQADFINKQFPIILAMFNAIKLEGTIYGFGRSEAVLNQILSGTSSDWAAIRKPDILSITWELPPDRLSKLPNPFHPPEEQILVAGRELFAGLKAMARKLAEKNSK